MQSTDTGTKGMASNFLAKALEKLAKGDEIKQKHDDGKKEIDDAKQMFINLMQNAYTRKAPLAPENPYTPEITPVNPIVNAGMPPKEIAPRPFGVTLPNAPFATQDEADKDLLQQNVDTLNKQMSARQLGDTQNITTNTLGSGLVKQNVENVPGRLSIFEALKDTTTPNTKLTDAITLENIKAKNRMDLKNIGQEKALADIPIMTYDPLHPEDETKWKQVSTFKGRQGMGPRLIAKSNVMTDTANSTIASQDIAMGNLVKMKDLMEGGNIGNIGVTLAQKIPNNTMFNIAANALYNAGQIDENQLNSLLEFKAEFDSAKQNIAVARGGKQLTVTELQLILNTLPTAFQNPSIWDSIINRYANEFNTYRKGLTKGKSDVGTVNTESKKEETKGGIKIGSAMKNLLKKKE